MSFLQILSAVRGEIGLQMFRFVDRYSERARRSTVWGLNLVFGAKNDTTCAREDVRFFELQDFIGFTDDCRLLTMTILQRLP